MFSGFGPAQSDLAFTICCTPITQGIETNFYFVVAIILMFEILIIMVTWLFKIPSHENS